MRSAKAQRRAGKFHSGCPGVLHSSAWPGLASSPKPPRRPQKLPGRCTHLFLGMSLSHTGKTTRRKKPAAARHPSGLDVHRSQTWPPIRETAALPRGCHYSVVSP